MTLIDKKYQELGGAGGFLGHPRGPETETPDGRGHFRHFEGGSIYATLETDAHEVHGAIREKWAELKWERGFLGYPTTDETRTPDGRGRFNHFEGGSIYWTPETGAHEVHGAIRGKWAELKWERGFLGYPTTDETRTPDGRGRFNHFEGGSIYWTPETGAHEVHGAIRKRWAELGWERSFLGYPTTDERKTPDGHGRYSRFQGGSIHWTSEGGAREQKATKPADCSISGRAYGPGVAQASVFRVSLYGPDDLHVHRKTQPFDASGRYAFTGLPRGRYRVTVDTKADLMLGPHPSRRDVDCRGGAEKGIDFELR
jgi:uncharacterized protein with LGFP repeats